MNKLFQFLIYASTGVCALAQTPSPAIPADPQIEADIKVLLGKMTLDEKIGQMTELTLETFVQKGADGKFQIKESLDTVLKTYKVGSILNSPQYAVTPKEWENIIGTIQEKSMK